MTQWDEKKLVWMQFLLKYGSEVDLLSFTKLFNEMLKSKKMSNKWRKSLLVDQIIQ